jgi:hypothetical protein
MEKLPLLVLTCPGLLVGLHEHCGVLVELRVHLRKLYLKQ